MKRALIKTLVYRSIVILLAVLIPRVVYGDWNVSPLVLGMAILFTFLYYINEKIWDRYGEKK